MEKNKRKRRSEVVSRSHKKRDEAEHSPTEKGPWRPPKEVTLPEKSETKRGAVGLATEVFKRTLKSWVPQLSIKSGECINFQAARILLLTMISTALITPLRWVKDAISMSPVFQAVHEATKVSVSKLKHLFENTAMEDMDGEQVLRVPVADRSTETPSVRMILVMDNASYHKQQSTEFYTEGKGPATASKGLNAHVLRKAGCTQIEIKRGEATLAFSVPVEEPAHFADHREHGGRSPSCEGLDGTVYARSPKGPSSEELALATSAYLKVNCPQALESKVERLFAEKNWKIIWTPPYCPKFQPIELVWGGGKQRAAQLYRPGRNLELTLC